MLLDATEDPNPYKVQVLVQWSGLSPEESTWENKVELLQEFPNIHLKDKVFVMGERDDSPITGKMDETLNEDQTSSPIANDANEKPRREHCRPAN